MTIKVLIADDEPNQIELISYNLKQAGFEVTHASDGQKALHMAENILPDIIVLDWMMPVMSGIEVCKTLRSMAETKNIPVIMLSARGEEGDKTLGLDIGADDYMTKPFSPKELVARIHAVLRRSRPALTQNILEFGSLRLYPAKKLVERDGHRVDLGPKEFRILALLMERPGQVFSRTQLLDHVWGHGIYIDDRTIDVHMSRLRKALQRATDGNPQPDLIRTVRGSGYALTDSE
jgi:two-component system phosphate regulon response regulator PhoB